MGWVVSKKEFVKAIEFLSRLSNEAVITISEGKMRSSVIDASKMSLGIIEVDVVGAEECEFGVDITKLASVAKNMDGEIEILRENGVVILRSGQIVYEIREIEGLRKPKQLTIDYTAVIRTSGDELKKAILVCKKVSDTIVFDGGKVTAEGDVEEATYTFSEFEGNGRAGYSLTLIEQILKVLDDDAEVAIKYATDKPMEIEINGKVRVKYFIAPRVL